MIQRRAVVAGALAAPALVHLPRPARAQDRFAPAFDRAGGFEQLRALVISVDGETVAGEAIRGPGLDTPVNVKSVSKSVVAALTGQAIGSGALSGVDATIGEIAPSLIPAGAAPEVSDITVADLVTMRAGLERTSGGNYGAWVASSNWVADALGREMVAEPGGRFLYSTGSFHILGAVLTAATGDSLLTLARDGLGDPLGILIPPWTQDPQGRYMGGNNMALSPNAMIRFGEVYRRGGTYDGTQVLPADWVAESLEPRASSPWSGDGYGYGLFLTRWRGNRVAYARGYGGQFIWAAPDLGVTVAVTSDPNRPARSQGYAGALQDMVAETILPIVADGTREG